MKAPETHCVNLLDENDQASVDELDYLPSMPGELSVTLLHLDPTWDSIRDHPHFIALLNKYGGAAAG